MSRWNRVALVLGTAAALVTVTSCAGSGGNAQSSGSALPTDGVRTAMAALVKGDGPPGVIVVMQQGDDRTVVAQGTADLATGSAMTPDAVARIASVSKAYSGAVVLALVEQGKLSLDSPLSDVLPDTPLSWQRVTVAQTLQHTSGLPDYIKSPAFVSDFMANPQMQRTPQQLLAYVAGQAPAFPGGTQYLYSDTDNIVAGLVAEAVSGKSYEALLSDLVTDPLGASQTKLPADATLPPGFIHGYEAVVASSSASGSATAAQPAPEDVSQFLNPGLAWASGGLVSTADELNRFIRWYAPGTGLKSTLVTAQRQFVPGAGGPPGPGTNSSGLGIYQYQTTCGTVLGHTGNMPGYTAFVAATPDGSRSVAVIANGQINDKGSSDVYKRLLDVEQAAICAVTGGASPSASAS